MLHYEGNMLRIRIFSYTEIRICFRLLCTYMPEGCSKQWYCKPAVMVACKKCGSGGGMKQWHCCILCLSRCSDVQYGNTGFRKHSWFTPLTRLSIHIADTSLRPLQYLWSLNIFPGCCIIYILVANRMSSCPELNPWHKIHILVSGLQKSYLSVVWLLQL
jgi:hypothetical protein